MSRIEVPGAEPALPTEETQGRALRLRVLMIALVCGVVAAVALWRADGQAQSQRAAHLHHVTAVTTAAAGTLPEPGSRYGVQPRSVVPARWEQPAGVPRAGKIDVPLGTGKGATVPLWVDDTGAPAQPPGTVAGRALGALSGGALVTATAGLTMLGCLRLARRRTERHLLAAWEREWEEVEPVWSGRPRRDCGPDTGEDGRGT
ncbi:hypothetical protein ACFW9D_04245 [Streptomyces sp. NPDC059524]|uniref:Rv1733c family protein n=1 Tax=Streptomyces sp. NPDC059524 TaxID=3346856 RepID=UPI00369B81A6